MARTYPRILRNGEAALTVEFGDVIAPETHTRVVALDIALAAASITGIVEALPTYRSLYVSFDPSRIDFETVASRLYELVAIEAPQKSRAAAHWLVPVCFETPFGEDIGALAENADLTEIELIKAFCETPLKVYMFGFAPGYAFMGKLPERLTFPRRQTPRPPIQSGTLISAGGQASLATCPMPTGWHILGRTPEQMWSSTQETPTPFLKIGDTVSFEPISVDVFDALAKRAAAGEQVVTQIVLS